MHEKKCLESKMLRYFLVLSFLSFFFFQFFSYFAFLFSSKNRMQKLLQGLTRNLRMEFVCCSKKNNTGYSFVVFLVSFID